MSKTEPADHLDPALAIELPSSVNEALAKWQKASGCTIQFEQWLTTGNTPAKVAVVIVSGKEAISRVIVKFCPPERLTAREPRLHAEALENSSSDFARDHLVRMPFETVEAADKWRVLFQAIAGDSLRHVRPLASVIHDERLPALVSAIVSGLLIDWNADFDSRKIIPQEFLSSELGTKTDRNGPLVRFSQEIQLADQRWVRFADSPATVVPNAIFWGLSPTAWPADTKPLWARFGNVHGDLHPDNILIHINPEPNAELYRLIDMSCYQPDGSIIRDAVHLGLSILNQSYHDSPVRRRDLLTIALGDERHVPLNLHGIRATYDAVTEAARVWISSKSPGMADDWEDQMSLSTVTEALQFVGRKALPKPQRAWLFQLACLALDRYLRRNGVAQAPEDPAEVPLIGQHLTEATSEAVQKVLDSCSQFDGSRTLICIVPESLAGEAANRLSGWPWTAVMSFDPNLDTTGPLSAARMRSEGLHRLVTVGQSSQYAHSSTTWIAVGGLSDIPGTVIGDGLRPWRRAYKATIDQSLTTLARFSPRPLTAITFGEPDARARTVVEAIDDRFDIRAEFVLVGKSMHGLDDFVDVHVDAEAAEVIAAMPDYEAPGAPQSAVPGNNGPLILEAQDREWIDEIAELIDFSSGTSAGETEDVGIGFLRGRTITWFELSLGLDLIPAVATDLVASLRGDLDRRDTRRVTLLHYPGAGGTTLARRAAWEMHREWPTLYCPALHDEQGLAERISRVSQITGMSTLVVIEQTTDAVAERLYNRLRGDSVPVVLLFVSRRSHRPETAGTRSFYLGTLTTAAEVAELAGRYTEFAPLRRRELEAVQPRQSTSVPFYFGLLAFETDFQGLTAYVQHAVQRAARPEEHRVLLDVSLIHRYGGVSVAADFFANVLSVDSSRAVYLERAIGDAAMGLLIEDEAGYWRTIHWLVAGEAVRQLLTPVDAAEPDSWRFALSSAAIGLIDEARRVFGPDLPDDIRDVLERLFLIREGREQFDTSRTRSFSELLEDIPSASGRLEVLRHLAESFPDRAHYWAHYGRLLSYEVGDSQLALEALNRALSLEEDDNVLYHIRGMIYRRRLRDIARPPADSAHEGELLQVAELALGDFTEAARLKDDSEYPYVASAQVAVDAIEAGYKWSGCSSHADFLSRPGSAPYRLLLAQAESAIDAIAEIEGGDQPSARVQEVNTELLALYDDYSGLLQGWRNLLDRADVNKLQVRRRLVRAYFHRAGGWAAMEHADLARVRALLEDNLRDDPTDSVSLRDWLRVARISGASLDRASELASYWASESTARDALYYDYVLSVLQVFAGRNSIAPQAIRKIERCRERASSFGNRKFSYEWLRHGTGLGALVHYSELPSSWDRNSAADTPSVLLRVPARIARISSPQSGVLRLSAGGLDAFFVPALAGALRSRHENAQVDAVLGFSYDGLRAWSVRLTDDGRTYR
jgi:hypothetical protein